jgi:hypothetical protein
LKSVLGLGVFNEKFKLDDTFALLAGLELSLTFDFSFADITGVAVGVLSKSTLFNESFTLPALGVVS